MELLLTYDKNNISASIIKKLEEKVIPQPDFNLQSVERCSFATKFLYMWCRAMYDYYNVYVKTQPLRETLEKTNKLLEEKTAELRVKKEALEKINRKI